jgi:hypothetical protein
MEEYADEDGDIDLSSSDDEATPFALPADRGLKVFHALPGILRPPELPEEFYEVTEEDSRTYARGIRMEAAKFARGASREQAMDTALDVPADEGPPNTPFAKRDAAASSTPTRSGLLDSSRLPALPSAQDRRNARIKRKCRASLLRVRLPNHLYVEALFKLEETPKELYRFLDTLLDEEMRTKHSYYLYLTPPRQIMSRNSHLTFAQLGLYPQALVHLGSEVGREQAHASGAFTVAADTAEEITAREQPGRGVLKPALWSAIVQVRPPTPTPASVATTAVTHAQVVEQKHDEEGQETKEKEQENANSTPAAATV